MRAMQLEAAGRPLAAVERAAPVAAAGQIALTVEACGVCRTDLHLIDGEVAVNEPPRILGHQIVGRADDGARYGVPWLGWTCGKCEYCTSGRENLCPSARFTGCDIDGGFAEFAVADARYAFPLPGDADPVALAPLLCAGLIGYRCLRFCGDARWIGIYGFGAAAHLITQVAIFQGREVFAFTRAGDDAARAAALELGCAWAGASGDRPPDELDAAIIFAPAGELVPLALKVLAPGGTVVCGGIHMSEIPAFDYDLLWRERSVRSVANLTRLDATEFLEIAPAVPVTAKTTIYPLEETNTALEDLRAGRFTGSAVVVP
jgi:propanol-preferring alcohol dehydrogenase